LDGIRHGDPYDDRDIDADGDLDRESCAERYAHLHLDRDDQLDSLLHIDGNPDAEWDADLDNDFHVH